MDEYVVIGNPIEHSLSPRIHTIFAKQTNQAMHYEVLFSAPDAFAETLTEFIAHGGCGASITLPFKQQAFEIVTKKSQAAIESHAVNTVLFHEDGIVEGYNTDGLGLVQDLTRNRNFCLRQKRILILGAGGAVRGIVAPLLEQAPAAVVIANRTKEKAVALAEQFQFYGTVDAVGLDELETDPFDLIIHGTSVRAAGVLDLPEAVIGKNTWCYDLNYALKQKTPFVSWALAQGAAQALDGLGMLVEQAAAAFYIWRGVYPDTLNAIQQLEAL